MKTYKGKLLTLDDMVTNGFASIGVTNGILCIDTGEQGMIAPSVLAKFGKEVNIYYDEHSVILDNDSGYKCVYLKIWFEKLNDTPEIPPCPFCGFDSPVCGQACDFDVSNNVTNSQSYVVLCSQNDEGCGAKSCYCETREEALAKWSIRNGVQA